MRIIPKNSESALRASGLRLTGPRRVVLEVLRGTESHPTAEWVHRLVRRRLPRVSLGTVYRNLRLLVAAGLAAEIQGPHARFDANVVGVDASLQTVRQHKTDCVLHRAPRHTRRSLPECQANLGSQDSVSAAL